MKIREFAERCHLSVHALRHYEALGLLVPARLPNGWRDYAPQQLREAVFIAMSRQVGVSLPVLAEHLPAYRAGRLKVSDMVEELESMLQAIERQMAGLEDQRRRIADHAAWLRTRAEAMSPPAASWPPARRQR